MKTHNPTQSPSNDPSKPPSVHPSVTQTNNPIPSPSNEPGIPSNSTTIGPTPKVTRDGEVNADGVTSTMYNYITNKFIGNDRTESNEKFIIIIIAIGISVLFCFCAIAIVFIVYKWEYRQQTRLNDNINVLSKTVKRNESVLKHDTNILRNQEMENKVDVNKLLQNVDDKHVIVTTKGIDEIENDAQNQEENLIMVFTWLKSVVKLPQYYSLFVENGYESLDIIREIKDESELQDIGIQLSDTQQIMRAIKHLKNTEEAVDKQMRDGKGLLLDDENYNHGEIESNSMQFGRYDEGQDIFQEETHQGISNK